MRLGFWCRANQILISLFIYFVVLSSLKYCLMKLLSESLWRNETKAKFRMVMWMLPVVNDQTVTNYVKFTLHLLYISWPRNWPTGAIETYFIVFEEMFIDSDEKFLKICNWIVFFYAFCISIFNNKPTLQMQENPPLFSISSYLY